MENHQIFIKNMVCPRCVQSVTGILNNLNIPFSNVELGRIELTSKPTSDNLESLSKELNKQGFELLEDENSRIISQIKDIVIQNIYYSDKPQTQNFSDLLSQQLNHEYTYLSKLFSSVEGETIARYIVKQKTERIKELMMYDELSLSQIADQMGYSSVAYLSAQFKKETGMTPSEFKTIHPNRRKFIDKV